MDVWEGLERPWETIRPTHRPVRPSSRAEAGITFIVDKEPRL